MAPSFWEDLRFNVFAILMIFISSVFWIFAINYFYYSDLLIRLYIMTAEILIWAGLLFQLYGAILNILVRAFNGGLMPVLINPEELTPQEAGGIYLNVKFSDRYCFFGPATKLKLLADRIVLRYPDVGIASSGDLLIIAGKYLKHQGVRLAKLSLASSFVLWIFFKT